MNPRGNVNGDLMHYRQAVHLDLAIKLDRGEITKEQAEVQFKAINAQLEAEMLRRQAAQRAQIMQAGAAALANQPASRSSATRIPARCGARRRPASE